MKLVWQSNAEREDRHWFLGDFDLGKPDLKKGEICLPSFTPNHYHVIRRDIMTHYQLYSEIRRRKCDPDQLIALELNGFVMLDVQHKYRKIAMEIQRFVDFGRMRDASS